MKTFSVCVTCENAEQLSRALRDAADHAGLFSEEVDAMEVDAQADVGSFALDQVMILNRHE
jgi:hypothetical protein